MYDSDSTADYFGFKKNFNFQIFWMWAHLFWIYIFQIIFVMAMASDSTRNLTFSDSFECVLIHFDFIFVRWFLFYFVGWEGIQKFKIIGYRILYPSIFYFWNQVFWIWGSKIPGSMILSFLGTQILSPKF